MFKSSFGTKSRLDMPVKLTSGFRVEQLPSKGSAICTSRARGRVARVLPAFLGISG